MEGWGEVAEGGVVAVGSEGVVVVVVVMVAVVARRPRCLFLESSNDHTRGHTSCGIAPHHSHTQRPLHRHRRSGSRVRRRTITNPNKYSAHAGFLHGEVKPWPGEGKVELRTYISKLYAPWLRTLLFFISFTCIYSSVISLVISYRE